MTSPAIIRFLGGSDPPNTNPVPKITPVLTVAILLVAAGCIDQIDSGIPATAEGAEEFVAQANAELEDLSAKSSRANWVSQNFITHDTEQISAEARKNYVAAQTAAAGDAARWNGVEVDPTVRRQLDLMRTSITMPAPADPDLTAEVTEIVTRMRSNYGKGKYCPTENEDGCLTINDITKIHAESRDAEELLDVWTGWRTISTGSRADYQRFAELMNEGSQELGFSDTGELWRSAYDMEPDAFAEELDRLWEQVLPLYESLHCYTRKRLSARQQVRNNFMQQNRIVAHRLRVSRCAESASTDVTPSSVECQCAGSHNSM